MKTAATLVELGTARARSRRALEVAAEQLATITTARPISPIRFTGYERPRVARYEADYPDDAA